ncbi:MAG TPA: DUF1254 domain-containing protein [Anaerolineae bacterium]|nr:DUF1254 domain-containing protein [Anaerolineae bacterium]
MSKITQKEIKQIAEEAYIYAFPMLMGYRFAFASFLMPVLPSYRGPVNTLTGKAATLDHTFKDVITPNADTPYSMALLDLRAEPVVLQVPAITDRYYVFQFVDLFGTNPHFIGSRATGTKAGTYLAVGPGWKGEAGDVFDAVLPFDTDLAFVIGRTQLLGVDDIPALAKVMASYKLQTLSAYRGQSSPTPPAVQWPIWNDEASRDERFIGTLNFLLTFCQPIHPSEADVMARYAKIGIGPGLPFDADALDGQVRDTLRAGIAAARETMAAKLPTIAQQVNGWTFSDVFGTRAWYGGNFIMRAVAAMAGWGGNDVIEAIYPTARADTDGNPLDGAHRYQITFTTPPPAKAFWSITMYDTTYDGAAGYLVENPINRYLINSTTAGLVHGKDGSLTVTIQRAQPQDTAERANWLPAPEGPFYLVMRIYWPEKAALDGTWTPPSVVRQV